MTSLGDSGIWESCRQGPKLPICLHLPNHGVPLLSVPALGIWGSLKPSTEERHQLSDGWIMTQRGGWQQRAKAARGAPRDNLPCQGAL